MPFAAIVVPFLLAGAYRHYNSTGSMTGITVRPEGVDDSYPSCFVYILYPSLLPAFPPLEVLISTWYTGTDNENLVRTSYVSSTDTRTAM